MTKDEENRLVERCLADDRAACRQFFELYSGKMLGVCYRYVPNIVEAEDVLQEGFIKIFTHLSHYDANGSLEGWMRRIMVNTAIDYLRVNKKYQGHADVQEQYQLVADEQQDIYMGKHELLKAIGQLPEEYRIVLNLHVIEGYSHAEIAAGLGIAESSSRSRLSRARQLLRIILEKKSVMHE